MTSYIPLCAYHTAILASICGCIQPDGQSYTLDVPELQADDPMPCSNCGTVVQAETLVVYEVTPEGEYIDYCPTCYRDQLAMDQAALDVKLEDADRSLPHWPDADWDSHADQCLAPGETWSEFWGLPTDDEFQPVLARPRAPMHRHDEYRTHLEALAIDWLMGSVNPQVLDNSVRGMATYYGFNSLVVTNDFNAISLVHQRRFEPAA